MTDRNGAVPCSASFAEVTYRPRLLPLTEILLHLSISQNTAYRLIGRVEFPLPLVRVGRRWYVRSVDLDALVGADDSSP